VAGVGSKGLEKFGTLPDEDLLTEERGGEPSTAMGPGVGGEPSTEVGGVSEAGEVEEEPTFNDHRCDVGGF
jgi:hypothetical protein